jgi:hypothetical protein
MKKIIIIAGAIILLTTIAAICTAVILSLTA